MLKYNIMEEIILLLLRKLLPPSSGHPEDSTAYILGYLENGVGIAVGSGAVGLSSIPKSARIFFSFPWHQD
jgi:hypothetical protein